jgi:hypothetical protein
MLCGFLAQAPGGMVTLCLRVTMQPFAAHGHATAKRDHATLSTSGIIEAVGGRPQ